MCMPWVAGSTKNRKKNPTRNNLRRVRMHFVADTADKWMYGKHWVALEPSVCCLTLSFLCCLTFWGSLSSFYWACFGGAIMYGADPGSMYLCYTCSNFHPRLKDMWKRRSGVVAGELTGVTGRRWREDRDERDGVGQGGHVVLPWLMRRAGG